MSEERELKLCPHCGGRFAEVSMGVELGLATSEENFAVVCDFRIGGCGAIGGFRRTEEEAIAAWNLRQQVPDDLDTKRLDWLERNHESLYRVTEEVRVPTTMVSPRYEKRERFIGWTVGPCFTESKTPRDAIDAAMLSVAPKPEDVK